MNTFTIVQIGQTLSNSLSQTDYPCFLVKYNNSKIKFISSTFTSLTCLRLFYTNSEHNVDVINANIIEFDDFKKEILQ